MFSDRETWQWPEGCNQTERRPEIHGPAASAPSPGAPTVATTKALFQGPLHTSLPPGQGESRGAEATPGVQVHPEHSTGKEALTHGSLDLLEACSVSMAWGSVLPRR